MTSASQKLVLSRITITIDGAFGSVLSPGEQDGAAEQVMKNTGVNEVWVLEYFV